MNILPVALTPKKIVLIGAGKAAALKAKGILESSCKLTIIAKEVKESYFDDKNVVQKPFSLTDIKDCEIVINAAGDEELSKLLWDSRKKYGFLLNCVDMPKYCDFYFTANFRNHDLCISVSTNGTAPKYAQSIRNLLKAVIPLQSKNFYKELKAKRVCNNQKVENGKVFLIGCGTGKKDNLTIKALNTLKIIDVALIDSLVGKEIVDLLPSSCQKIDVSKQKGSHTFSQCEINQMLLDYTSKGLNVGRLKGGDPAVFGRVFEEASFLTEQGILVEMISGVSSVFAGCLAGGITPTLRDFSAGALIVSAHLKESKFNDDWIAMLKEFPYTIIVLMAHSFADKIVKKAQEYGIDQTIPSAFVSKIDGPEQTTVIGTLGNLKNMAKLCDKPAILVIGKAVAKAGKMPFSGKRVILEN